MTLGPAMLSHKTGNWATPSALYGELDKEFRFDFDPCPLNGHCGPLYGFDGLHESWKGKRVFCNPPYGPRIADFISKATEADVAVFLVPARTDVRWFHELVLPIAAEIRFVKGRLRFGDAENPAPFPSMILVYRKAGH